MPGGFKRVVELWEVTVAAHRIEPRYDIAERTATYGGPKQRARLSAIKDAHRAAGVPPWKPYVRESWPHAAATRRDQEVRA